MSAKGKDYRSRCRGARDSLIKDVSQMKKDLAKGELKEAQRKVKLANVIAKKYGWKVRISPSGKRIVKSGF